MFQISSFQFVVMQASKELSRQEKVQKERERKIFEMIKNKEREREREREREKIKEFKSFSSLSFVFLYNSLTKILN